MKQIEETTPNGHQHESVYRGRSPASPVVGNSNMPTGHPDLHLADADTWRKWSRMRRAALWQAVALHCQLDPDRMNLRSIKYFDIYPSESNAHLYQERIVVARQYVRDGIIDSHGHPDAEYDLKQVMLPDYAQWAQSLEMPLPPEFPRVLMLKTIKHESTSKWPWGSHDTALLAHLAAAANHFWKPVSEGGNYDPERPVTAKSNDAIEAWLIKRGVSQRMARAIPTILHADDMPEGPRTQYRKKVG